MKLTNACSTFAWRLRWAAAFFLGICTTKEPKETYGFRTTKAPPHIPQLAGFEDRLQSIVENVKFRPGTNKLQKKMRGDLSKIKKSKKMYLKADKTSHFYTVDEEEHNRLMKRNITADYKKTSTRETKKVTKDDKKIAEKLEIANRVYQTQEREASHRIGVMFFRVACL